MRFWVVFRSERAVSTIFPPYIMPNGTYERIKKFSDTLPLRVTHMPSIASYSNLRNPLSYIRSSLPISNPHLNSYCVHLETIDLLNRSTIQNSALVVFGRNPSFNLAIEGFKKSFFTFQATGKYLGLGCGIGHVGIHWPRDTITSLRRAGGVWSMFWQPRVVDRSLRYLQYLHSLAFLSPYK